MRDQVENPKGWLDYEKDTQIENLKRRSRKKELIKGIQGMESCDNQTLLVCGKAEFDICLERTKDIGRGTHSRQNLRPVDIEYFKCSLCDFPFCTPILP